MTQTTGTEILSYCTSCKLDLAHTIAAMMGDQVKRVLCRTCKKEHVYRAPKGITEVVSERDAALKAPTKKEKAAAVAIADQWNKLMSGSRGKHSMAYSTKVSFSRGDLLAHPTFGDGVVEKLIHPNKIEVVFQTDVKILIHGGPRL